MIFKDKVVVITGGAQGIGKCCVECFAREGATNIQFGEAHELQVRQEGD